MSPKLRNLFIVAVAASFIILMGSRIIFGSRSFDPDTVAEAETQMWKAYYTRDKMELGMQIITLLRGQYGLSFGDAKKIGEKLARTSMKFAGTRGDYDKVVLPDLIEVYTMIRDAGDESFDPEAAARAELAWWVARRTPGENSVEQVGDKIAELYAILYGHEDPAFKTAGHLRAKAAALRDAGGKNADWDKIEKLLKESYSKLAEAVDD